MALALVSAAGADVNSSRQRRISFGRAPNVRTVQTTCRSAGRGVVEAPEQRGDLIQDDVRTLAERGYEGILSTDHDLPAQLAPANLTA